MLTRRWLVFLLLTLSALLVGCDDRRPDATPTTQQRIVSLAPALTQMAVDLGAADRIVGIAHNDYAAPEGLPVVGHYQHIRGEALLATAPSHVLTATTSRQPPARLQHLAEQGRFQLIAYPYPGSIDEVLRTLYHDPVTSPPSAPPSVGHVLNLPDAARQLRQRIEQQLQAMRDLTADRPRPRVLVIIGLDPLYASGPGTVLDEMVRIAGGRNAAAPASVTAPSYNREGLVELSPDVILLALPAAPSLTDTDPRLASLRGLPIPAVENERIVLINDPLAVLPSSSIPRITAEMLAAIHPDLADAARRTVAER